MQRRHSGRGSCSSPPSVCGGDRDECWGSVRFSTPLFLTQDRECSVTLRVYLSTSIPNPHNSSQAPPQANLIWRVPSRCDSIIGRADDKYWFLQLRAVDHPSLTTLAYNLIYSLQLDDVRTLSETRHLLSETSQSLDSRMTQDPPQNFHFNPQPFVKAKSFHSPLEEGASTLYSHVTLPAGMVSSPNSILFKLSGLQSSF